MYILKPNVYDDLWQKLGRACTLYEQKNRE